MSWDARICINGHLGTAKRCHCGKDTVEWQGEGPAQTEFDRRVEEMLRQEKDRPKE